MPHIFNGKDVMAILLTGFGKSLIFQLFVTMCRVRSKRRGGICFSGIIVISPLQGIIQSIIVRLGRQIQHGKNLIRKIQDKKFTTPPERSCLKCLRFHPVRLRAKYFQISCSGQQQPLPYILCVLEYYLQLLAKASSCYTIVALYSRDCTICLLSSSWVFVVVGNNQ